jgi:hypothetical protein
MNEPNNQVHAQNITPQAEVIFEIVQGTDTWITRREIARKLEKNRLNPWDIALLEKLADEDYIEINRRLRSDKVTLEYIYRAKDRVKGD